MPFVEPGFVEPGFVEGDSLLDLLNDVEANLNVVAEVSSVKRSDGSSKTWYFARFVNSLIQDAHPDALPYLVSVGQLSKSLSADSLFGGLAEVSGGNITLIQSNLPTDNLFQLLDYTFSGQEVAIKIGRLLIDPYAEYATLCTLTVEQEPTYSPSDTGLQISMPLASPISRLMSQSLGITRYLGVPTCARFNNSTSKATATHLAAYDLTHFTVIVWFRINPAPSDAIFLSQKSTAATTANNWRLAIDTLGRVHADASTGGTGFAFQVDSPNAYTNQISGAKVFHSAALSVNGSDPSFLMVDGVITNTFTPSGLVDTPNTDILMGVRPAGTTALDMCYSVLVAKYLSEDEARIISATRQDFADSIYAGAWIFDDNDPATSVFDYSPNANSAAISGVRNTDYSWQPSDLGESALAGKSHPFVLGLPFNYPPDLIDTPRNRYRFNNVDLFNSDNRTVNLKSQGTALALGLDYTLPTNYILQTTATEDQPVTLDSALSGSPSGQDNTIIRNACNTVSGIMSIDTSARDRMVQLLPWLNGYFSGNDPSYGEVVSSLFGGSSFYYSQNNSGEFTPGFFLPPLGANVYGGPVIDFRGGAGLSFEPVGNLSGSRTLACWFQTYATDQGHDVSRFEYLGFRSGSYEILYYSSGVNAGKLWIKIGDTASFSFFSPAGLIQEGVKTFVAVSFDNVTHTCNLYICPEGGTLSRVKTVTGIGSVNDSFTSQVTIGTFVFGSVSHFQIWNSALSSSAIQGLIDSEIVGNESGLVLCVPGTEGRGRTVTEVVSGTTATMDVVTRWVPTLDLDLSLYPSVRLTEYRNLETAWKIVIRHSRNWSVMSDADIDQPPGVPMTTRQLLRKEWQEAVWEDAAIRTRYARAQSVSLDSTLVRKSDAQRLLRMLRTRLQPGRVLATLSISTGDIVSTAARRALALDLEDEVRIRTLSADRHFRVSAISKDPVQIAANVVLWG